MEHPRNFAARTRVELQPRRDQYYIRVRPQMRDQAADTPPTLAAEIRTVLAALLHHKWWVAGSTVLGLLAGFAYLMAVTPMYEATAQILIDPRGKRILEGSVVPIGLGSSSVGADTLLVDSQVELISSTAVLNRVVETQLLADDQEFMIPQSGGLRRTLRNSIGAFFPGFEPEAAVAAAPGDVAMERFRRRHLFVNRVGNTYVIAVEVISREPEKAARLANAVARSYLMDQKLTLKETTRETTDSLSSRIGELRERVRVAENAVEEYRTRSGLIGTPGLLVDEQQLQQLNSRLSQARARASAARSRLDQVRRVDARSPDAGATAEALTSGVISNLRTTLASVTRREAQLRQILGPGHPDIAAVQAEKNGVLSLIRDELGRIQRNAQGDYDLARANEAALEREIEELKSRASTNNQSLVRLRELEREAQAARAVFEAFLQRSKETEQQEQLSTDNTRIISEARTPEKPFSPATMLVALASLLGGLGLGVLLAWLRHILSEPEIGDLGSGITIERLVAGHHLPST